MTIRYYDLINTPKETHTSEDIIENIKNKLINLDSEEVKTDECI